MAWYSSIRVAREPVAVANLFMCADCHQVQTAFTAEPPASHAFLIAEFAEVTLRLNEALARSTPLLAKPVADSFLGRRTVEPIRADRSGLLFFSDGAITSKRFDGALG